MWGQAGHRLTRAEVAQRARARAALRDRERAVRAADEQVAHRLWEHGLVRSYRITMALDLQGLYGPGVDGACGVEEPTVDLWEAGVVYPTWEQLLTLARLTGFGPGFFTREALTPEDIVTRSSLCWHRAGGLRMPDDDRPVVGFTPEAVAATIRGR